LWPYHHLTITGPADDVAAFAVVARGTGVTPWRLDFGVLEDHCRTCSADCVRVNAGHRDRR